jgi:ABC-type Zn uptake system ZnuABC Zn-binding protein ZnuA
MSHWKYRALFFKTLIICGFVLAGCSQEAINESGTIASLVTQRADLSPIELGDGEQLRLVVTTNIIADVVQNVGGEAIEIVSLIPPGADPHTFQPSPGDLRAMTHAHVIMINGAGLEEFLYDTLAQIADEVPIISLSEGIELRQYHTDGDADEHDDHAGVDPHVWFDPLNIVIWAENCGRALGTLDVENRNYFSENTQQYVDTLTSLHDWIENKVAEIPEENRKLVTDHLTFGYFAQRYGFTMVGAVIPAFSTSAEPSAQELAKLNDTIGAEDVPAVFVGIMTDSRLAALIAQDTGVDLVPLYTGSLSEPGGPADTYIRLMQYDVNAIVQALTE